MLFVDAEINTFSNYGKLYLFRFVYQGGDDDEDDDDDDDEDEVPLAVVEKKVKAVELIKNVFPLGLKWCVFFPFLEAFGTRTESRSCQGASTKGRSRKTGRRPGEGCCPGKGCPGPDFHRESPCRQSSPEREDCC